MDNQLALFEEREIRKIRKNKTWYFSIEDVIYALTGLRDPKQYINEMKQRVNCSDTKGILRIIQSIPSSKAEPFNHW